MDAVENEVLLSKHIPFGLYYDCDKHENVTAKRYRDLLREFETETEFITALKRYTRFNDLLFINDLRDLSESDFIRELDAHFCHYKRAAKDMTQWIDHTDKLVLGQLKVRSIDNKYLVSAYVQWSKEKRNQLPTIQSETYQPYLESIFNRSNNSFEICKELLEHLEITLDEVTNLKKSRIGNLVGLIIAIKETPGMLRLDLTEGQLLSYFNSHLGTTFKTLSKRTKGYEENFDVAKRYIKRHFKK